MSFKSGSYCSHCNEIIEKIIVRYYCPSCGEELPHPNKIPSAIVIPPDWILKVITANKVLAFKNPNLQDIKFIDGLLEHVREQLEKQDYGLSETPSKEVK